MLSFCDDSDEATGCSVVVGPMTHRSQAWRAATAWSHIDPRQLTSPDLTATLPTFCDARLPEVLQKSKSWPIIIVLGKGTTCWSCWH